MAFRRNNITKSGLQGLAEKYINDNFMALFSKVSGGNINYADLDTSTQNRIQTQWIPFQAEGNLDANYPLETRIYVPPSVKEIKSASLNAIATKYRMDSSIAENAEQFTTIDVNINMGGSTLVFGQTSSGGGGAISDTFFVDEWGTPPYQFEAPTAYIYNGSNTEVSKPTQNASGGFIRRSGTTSTLGSVNAYASYMGSEVNYADLRNFQHTHKVVAPSHTHVLSATSMAHSHSGTARCVLPKHYHNLNEGVKLSTANPSSIEVQINNTKVGKVLSGNGSTMTDIDVKKNIKNGWNIVKVIGAGVGRITIYGVVEVVIDPYWTSPS